MDRLACYHSPRGDRPWEEDASGGLSACGTWGCGEADQFFSNDHKVDKDGWCGRPGVTRLPSSYSFFKDDPIQLANMRGICSTGTCSGGSLISSVSADRASGFGIDLNGSEAMAHERSAGALQLSEMYKQFSKAPPPIHPRIKEKADKILYTSNRSNHGVYDSSAQPPRMHPHIQERQDEMPFNRIGQGSVSGIWADAFPPGQTDTNHANPAPALIDDGELCKGPAADLVGVQGAEAWPPASSYGSTPGADLQVQELWQRPSQKREAMHLSQQNVQMMKLFQVQESSQEHEPMHPLIKQKIQMMFQFQEQ